MKKNAFSLIELILVIILIGLTYSLVLGKLNKNKNITVNKIENLKSIINGKNINEVILYDKCKKILPQNLNIDDIKELEAYRVESDSLKKIEFTPIAIKDEIYDVCLRYKIFNNGSTSSFIIKQGDKYIVFYPYFRDSEVFKNKYEAIKALTNSELKDEYKDEI